MAERYEKLFSSYDKYCSVGSPALIVAEAILKDTKEDKVKAQLKFQNITNKTIKAVNIKIKAYDSFGRELHGIEEYQYADLSVFQGEYWGQDKAITLPNELTRTIKVGILSVVFQDDTIWECESNVWNKLSEPKKLYSLLLDDELVKQYKLEYGESAEYAYLEEEGIWHCTCGTINQSSAEKCYHCRASKDYILNCDLDVLKANADARVAKEKAEAEAQARIVREKAEREAKAEAERLEKERLQRAKRNKRIKISLIIASVFVILFSGIIVFNMYLLPNIKYNKAVKLQENGQYESAISIFLEVEGNKDSGERILQCKYEIASKLKDTKDYSLARETFNEIEEYLDSKEQIKECNYLEALDLIAIENYDQGYKMLVELGDYNDASYQVEKSKYERAVSLMEDKEYEESIKLFEEIPKYLDSKDLCRQTYYLYACQLFYEGRYLDALDYFEYTSGYKDTTSKILEVKYEYAINNKNKYNKLAYSFLKELIEEKYIGAKEVYDELFGWKVNITFLNELHTEITSINRDEYLEVNIKTEKWEWEGETPIVYIIYPNGEVETIEDAWDGTVSIDSPWGIHWEEGVKGTSGTLKIKVEDEKGNTVGSGSIKITD